MNQKIRGYSIMTENIKRNYLGKLYFLIKIKHVSNSYHCNIPDPSKNYNCWHSSQVTIPIHCVTHLHFNHILLTVHQAGWSSGNAVDIFGRCSVWILDITLAILTEGFHGFPQSLQENSISYFDYSMPGSYQVISNSSSINHGTIQCYRV
jgi:hypothetical protein